MRTVHVLRCSVLASASFLTALAARATTVSDSLAQFDAMVGNYNLIAIHNATFGGGNDIEGAVAVGGNLILSSGNDIGSKAIQDGNPTLYVAGTNGLQITGLVNLQSGYAALPGDSASKYSWNTTTNKLSYKPSGSTVGTLSMVNSSATLYKKTDGSDNPNKFNPAWNFTLEQTNFETISNNLASASANGHISVSSQNLVFSANSGVKPGIVVFNIDAKNDLTYSGGHAYYKGTLFSNVQFSVPTGYEYVVNVLNGNGANLFAYANFNAGSGTNRLLWNIVDAPKTTSDTITLDGFYGSVLAPTYTVEHHTGVAMNGQLVVNDLDYTCSELHFLTFDELPPTPEPSTYGLMGAAVLLGAGAWRRRAARKN